MKATLLTFAFSYATASLLLADTVTIGEINTKSYAPFGITGSGSAAYTGEYQQIYASNAFVAPFQITQVSFASYFPFSGSASYNLSVGLGVTNRSPAAPGTGFATGSSQVLSGAVSASFTTTKYDFDLPITLTTPFNYDPAQGNLLLDVVISSASGNAGNFGQIFNVDDGNAALGEVDNGASRPHYGLVTQFTGQQLPEPGSAVVLFCAAILLIEIKLRRKTTPAWSKQPTGSHFAVWSG